jgi:enoyl-CoA hydratase
MTAFEALRYEKRNRIAFITIARPKVLNALNGQCVQELSRAVQSVHDDVDVRVAILTGEGEKAFVAGADIAELDALGVVEAEALAKHTQAIFSLIENCGKPIIAAVNGACVAGGMEMLGGCDLRVAVPESYFGVMEPKRGLFAGGGTTVRLPRQIPYPAAMEFLLCADRVPAEQALAFGLLNAVVPADQLRDKAMEYAHRITANGPVAVRKTKESVLRGLAVDMKEAYRIESSIATEVFSSEDAKEGPTAFVEKRPPRWTGR